MHSLDDSGAVFNYHRNMAALHGSESSLALGWLNYNDQQIRFEALTGIADLKGKTILDAGCGYADLLVFLTTDNQPAHYYGVEQIPELMEEAKNRYGHLPSVTFIARNFMNADLPVVDYVFASGSLNYGSNDSGYIFKAISRLFESCKAGLAFNLLKYVPGSGLLVSYEPEIIIVYCRTLSNTVILKDDYDDQDYTVWMYR
ncbi:class I SAM-dependent methyltransferase [Mucilaginibacter calamicampi]|uniref:Class I SAM-dependent methyltransferase n=1 Tax=Mucilaginibacter calamicampi TaxID=1302352 RepID=A0ABW2YUU7_9SPHI